MADDIRTVEIGSILERVSKPVTVVLDASYRQIGIRSHGKGLFDKEPITGAQLGDKRVFWVEPDCFVVNIVFAWEMAVGRTSSNDIGKIASHRFPMFRPKAGCADVDYITYLFKTERGRELLALASPGGAGRNKTLGQNEFLRLKVRIPPINEQKRIAEILATWDRAIDNVEALIANSRAQKAALIQALLTGERRLLGLTGSWSDLKLGEAVLLDQRSLGANTPRSFRFRYISLSDVEPGLISDILPTLTFADAPSRARRKVQAGDILMATVRPNLRGFARVTPNHADCIASTGFAVLSPRPGFDPSFLFHCLFSQAVTDQIEALVVGSNYPAINAADVRNLKIRAPELEEQKAVGAVLDNSDAEITVSEKVLRALRDEKAALMQQLLTGKRRVKLAESEAA